jgi:outer membrane autotransporter protein
MQLSANNNPAIFNDDSTANSGVWGDIAGDWLSNNDDSSIGSPDFNLNSKSVVLGYQSGSQKFTWGIAGGYHNGDLDFNNRNASGDVDGWNIGLNGLWKGNSGVYLNGVLAYSHDSNSLTREDGLGTNKSDFNGHSISAQLELGKKFAHGKNVNFTPYLSLLGLKYDRDSVSEHGTGAGLNVGDASNSYFTSNLGVRIGKDFMNDDGSKRGGVMLGVSWQHQFSDVDFPVTAALQNAAPGSSFTVQGTPLSKNGIGLQLGGYGRLSKNILGFLNYSGSFSSNQKVNSVTAGVEYQF